ncbi:hypothetical protein D3C76_1397550 [compost metagenome]
MAQVDDVLVDRADRRIDPIRLGGVAGGGDERCQDGQAQWSFDKTDQGRFSLMMFKGGFARRQTLPNHRLSVMLGRV